MSERVSNERARDSPYRITGMSLAHFRCHLSRFFPLVCYIMTQFTFFLETVSAGFNAPPKYQKKIPGVMVPRGTDRLEPGSTSEQNPDLGFHKTQHRGDV